MVAGARPDRPESPQGGDALRGAVLGAPRRFPRVGAPAPRGVREVVAAGTCGVVAQPLWRPARAGDEGHRPPRGVLRTHLRARGLGRAVSLDRCAGHGFRRVVASRPRDGAGVGGHARRRAGVRGSHFPRRSHPHERTPRPDDAQHHRLSPRPHGGHWLWSRGAPPPRSRFAGPRTRGDRSSAGPRLPHPAFHLAGHHVPHGNRHRPRRRRH